MVNDSLSPLPVRYHHMGWEGGGHQMDLAPSNLADFLTITKLFRKKWIHLQAKNLLLLLLLLTAKTTHIMA